MSIQTPETKKPKIKNRIDAREVLFKEVIVVLSSFSLLTGITNDVSTSNLNMFMNPLKYDQSHVFIGGMILGLSYYFVTRTKSIIDKTLLK
jgi:hypothetical protein